MYKKVLGLIALGLFVLRPVEAVPVLDQSFEDPNGAANFDVLAQTFTVGLSGNLVSVDVATFTQSDETATIQILGTAPDGTPDLGQVLTSVTAPVGSLPAPALPFKSFDLPPIAVLVGDVLALAIFSSDPDAVFGPYQGTNNWAARFSGDGSAYGPGSGFQGVFTPNRLELLGFEEIDFQGQEADFLFRTFVDAGVVPEPTTLALLSLGLAGIGYTGRKKKRLH